jgi:hypothetical protein
MFKFRHAVEIGQETAYLMGNVTLVGQAGLGAYAFAEGGCSIVDGTTCVIPGVRWLYYAGGACQIASGVCLMGSSVIGAISPPAGFAVGGLGWGVQKIGNRIVDSANTVNPAPCITKVV